MLSDGGVHAQQCIDGATLLGDLRKWLQISTSCDPAVVIVRSMRFEEGRLANQRRLAQAHGGCEALGRGQTAGFEEDLIGI